MKTSLVTGATGQDGSYLIRKLLSEGRRVCALIRRASTSNMSRLSDLREGVQPNGSELIFCTGDLTDTPSLMRTLGEFEPDEVYNLAAQSDVRLSFDVPEFTGEVDGMGNELAAAFLILLHLFTKAVNHRLFRCSVYI